MNHVNKDVEEKVMDLIKIGYDQFKDGNYRGSAATFLKIILGFDGLSNSTKSILRLNMSNSFYYESLDSNYNIDYGDGEDSNLHRAQIDGTCSAVFMPSWWEPYYRLAEFYKKSGDYISAYHYSKVALYLNEESDEALELKEDLEDYSYYMMKHVSKLPNNTFERFNKIGKYYIEKYGNLIKECKIFKIKRITNTFLQQENIEKHDIQGISKDYKIPLEFVSEYIISNRSWKLLGEKKYDSAIECALRCIGNGTKLAEPYALLAHCIEHDLGNIKELEELYTEEMIVSLLLHSSMLPSKFSFNNPYTNKKKGHKVSPHSLKTDDFTENSAIVRAWSKLGEIYYYGSFGEDQSMEKSQFYFENSVANYGTKK